MADNDMARQHHQLNECESDRTPQDIYCLLRTGKSDVLQSMGLQRVEHDLAIKQKQEEHNCDSFRGQILFGKLCKKKIQDKRKDTNNISVCLSSTSPISPKLIRIS